MQTIRRRLGISSCIEVTFLSGSTEKEPYEKGEVDISSYSVEQCMLRLCSMRSSGSGQMFSTEDCEEGKCLLVKNKQLYPENSSKSLESTALVEHSASVTSFKFSVLHWQSLFIMRSW